MSTSGPTFWVAGFALATQSIFPRTRLNSKLYARILYGLDGRQWRRFPTAASFLHTVDVRGSLANRGQVRTELRNALEAMPTADVCVVDLRPGARAADVYDVYPGAWIAIGELLNEWRDSLEPTPHILILLPSLGDILDTTFARFHEMTDSGRATIVETSGQVRSTVYVNPDIAALAQLIAADAGSAMDALHEKMIRRIGYFPQFNDDDELEEYTRYYFDGEYCLEELRTLFAERLRSILDPSEHAAILYQEDTATWLLPAIAMVVNDLTDAGFDVEALSLTDPDEGKTIRTVVLVHPVFHRGRSLAALAEAATKWAPAARVYALVAVANTVEGVNPTIRVNSGALEVSHLMAVTQQTVSPHAFSPDPAYYNSPDGRERFLAITSADFWTLAIEGGFIPERDPPDYRPALACVPDFAAFIENNAAWIASKFQLAIQQLTGRSARDVTLAVISNEKAARKLGDVLTDTLGNAPLRIPRFAIRQWKSAPLDATAQKWREDEEEWLTEAQIAKASGRDLVIIDEFTSSGRTLADLASLLMHLGFRRPLLLAIAAFSRAQFDDTLSDYKAFALYTTEWELPAAASLMHAT